MSKKQTRRSISVSRETYDRLQAHVKANGQTGSGFVEDLLRGFFEMPERDQKEKVAPIPRYERKGSIPKIDMKTDMEGRPIARTTVIQTPVLEANGNWDKISDPVEKGPAGRVQVIRDMNEAKQAFEKPAEDKSKDAELLKNLDAASKIFTF